MEITATQLKENLGHYLDLAAECDIIVSKNGKPVAKITNPASNRANAMKSLFGILPDTVTAEEARALRAERRWSAS